MVFSEKQYMPHIVDLYRKFGHLLSSLVVIRLLGGDRMEIEKATQQEWNRIVEPKSQLPSIAVMINELSNHGKQVYLNVNNHFEGSAPLPIERVKQLLAEMSHTNTE